MSDQMESGRSVIRCFLTGSAAADKAHRQWLMKKTQSLREEREKRQRDQILEEERQSQMLDRQIQKNTERELKLKEWQERKAKERLDKKRQEIILLNKIPEPDHHNDDNLDEKRKEIFEKWVKMKLEKQNSERKLQETMRKMENEKKESRKFLADISYEHWKESAKSRNLVIPRNGSQFFGPKPKPVVRQEWISCHDLSSSNHIIE